MKVRLAELERQIEADLKKVASKGQKSQYDIDNNKARIPGYPVSTH